MPNLNPFFPPIDIVLVGASCRAAAFSSLHAGLRPWTLDLYRDRDLLAACPGRRIRPADYPRALPSLIAEYAPSAPLIYTGGLENYPEIVDRIARERVILGNDADTLLACRSPTELYLGLRRAGFDTPNVCFEIEDQENLADWLWKPLRGCGGRGITVASKAPEFERTEDGFFQKRVAGDAVSAVFVGAGGDAELMGLSRQLVGEPWLHAAPFGYCGNIAPFPCDETIHESIRSAGRELASTFGLRGLFGIDLIIDGERAWILELNPRYPASVEILERACGVHAMHWHIDACRENRLPDLQLPEGHPAGKVIVYAPRDLSYRDLNWPAKHEMNARFADIPDVDEHFATGQPIVTMLESGDRCDDVLRELKRRARELLANVE